MTTISYRRSSACRGMICLQLVATISLSFLLASADAGEYPRTVPDKVTVDQQVTESHFIFVGEPVRVFFTDAEYKEVPYEKSYVEMAAPPEAGGAKMRRALLEIKVIRVLWSPDDRVRSHVLRPFSTRKESEDGRPSGLEVYVAKYLAKQGIWFGRFSTADHYFERAPGKSEKLVRKEIDSPVELFNPRFWHAKTHAVPNPMPIERLEEVSESIRRVKAGSGHADPVAAPGPVDEDKIIYTPIGNARTPTRCHRPYTLTIYSTGRVFYDGRNCVCQIGERELQIPKETAKKWFDDLVDAGFLEIAKNPRSPQDVGLHELELHKDGRSNTLVFSYYSPGFTSRIRDAVREFHRTIKPAERWVRGADGKLCKKVDGDGE